MEQKSNKTIQERLTKINKDRKMLMMLLHKLNKQIEEAYSRIDLSFEALEDDRDFPVWELIDELKKRRKDYRKRLTKLTNKKHSILSNQFGDGNGK